MAHFGFVKGHNYACQNHCDVYNIHDKICIMPRNVIWDGALLLSSAIKTKYACLPGRKLSVETYIMFIAKCIHIDNCGTYIHTYIHTSCSRRHVYIATIVVHTYIHTYIIFILTTCMHIDNCGTYIHTFIHTYIHTYTHTLGKRWWHACTYIHAYIHTHIH
jgi:hypothetical protein